MSALLRILVPVVVSLSGTFLLSAASEGAPPPVKLEAVGMELIGIPAGSFRMGSDDQDPLRFPAELRPTEVKISRPFWLGKTEITRGQWQAVMGEILEPTFISSPKDLKTLSADLPMADVTWSEAIAFCDKLTRTERDAGRLPQGYVYSLPTEAQWEYACRAGAKGLVPASEKERDASTWFMKTSGPWSYSMGPRLNPVAQKKANAWGLHDTLGSVREWVLDAAAPYPGGSVTDPVFNTTVFPGKPQKDTFELRVMRGGSWLDGERATRAAARDWADPTKYATPPLKQPDGKPGADFRAGIVGFRLALIPEGLRAAIQSPALPAENPPAAPAPSGKIKI